MANPNDTPDLNNPAEMTLLDAYFAESAKGPEHRHHIAMAMWDDLSPAEQLRLRQESYSLYPQDFALGSLYTESILILGYVNRLAEAPAA